MRGVRRDRPTPGWHPGLSGLEVTHWMQPRWKIHPAKPSSVFKYFQSVSRDFLFVCSHTSSSKFNVQVWWMWAGNLDRRGAGSGGGGAAGGANPQGSPKGSTHDRSLHLGDAPTV